MNPRRLLATLLLLASVTVVLHAEERPVSPSSHAARHVEQIVGSRELPAIEVAVSSELRYLGTYTQQAMGGKAEFEQYVFADARAGKLGRVFIVHFEHVLAGVDFTFNYPRVNMVRLGTHEYLHQSWPAEDWSLLTSPEMQRLLAPHAVDVPRQWLVDRYVRTVDEARKAEIILFYLEPATALPAPVSELELGGAQRALWAPFEKTLAERALAVFDVRD